MFEYLNIWLLLLSILVSISILILYIIGYMEDEEYSNKFLIALIIMVLSTPFILSTITNNDIKEKLKLFKDGNSLRCITDSSEYEISKTNGWYISKDSFFNNNLIIRGDNCELKDSN